MILSEPEQPQRQFSYHTAQNDADLAECFHLRHEVFVLEQNISSELEFDEKDALCTHYLTRQGDVIVATARVLPQDKIARLGRFAVRRQFRGQNVGATLFDFIALDLIRRGFTEMLLHAQSQVVGFYEKLGFIAEGEEFQEAGIPHQAMRLTFNSPRTNA